MLDSATDRDIEQRYGIARSSVSRHRLRHMLRLEQDRVAVLERDRKAREQRAELAKAAGSDEVPVSVLVEALLGTRAQALKIKHIEERLERVAAVAEADKVPQHVAAVSGQQLRAVEVGSRLAGNPNFVPRAETSGGGLGGQRFSIQIILGDGRDVSITATPTPQPVNEDGVI
jgi:hypothetical protein